MYSGLMAAGLFILVFILQHLDIVVQKIRKTEIREQLEGLVRLYVRKLRHGWIDKDRGRFVSLVPLILVSGALDAFIVCDFTQVGAGYAFIHDFYH